MICECCMNKETQLDEVQRLVRIFTHDLRNPLLNINALVHETGSLLRDMKEAHVSGQQQMMDEIINRELPDMLEMLKSSAERMDAMVLGANDISHCLFDELECEAVDMRQIFLRCFALLKLADEGFELIFDAQEKMVYADPLIAQRIASELLLNAKKAVLAAGKGTSKRIIVNSERVGARLCFKVQDFGCGFLNHEVEQLFVPFFRGSQFSSGNGMGLTRVKAWVKNHGGVISAFSENGVTTMTFCLPAME